MNKTKDIYLESLLQRLTIKEKIGQLLQIAPFFFVKDLQVEVFGALRDLNLDEEKIFNAGSVLGIGSAKDMIEVQRKYLEKSEHKIPLLFMADIIHGYKTIFPVPIALAASFNPEVAKSCARVSATEATTAGIHVTFSPMADVTKDPRWGRVVEGFGEDQFLSSQMAKAMVEGYRGKGLDEPDALASCVKHFAGYGASLAGRDYNTVNLSKLEMYSEYLKPYKAALDSGARLIMTAFNTYEGVPCTVNRFLLKTVLRDMWKSDAITISDYDSLRQVIAHGVAKNTKEAAYKGITSGLDIEMQSATYSNYLEDLVSNGKVDITLIDEAVYRILKLKKDLGLFDNPYKGVELDDSNKVLTKENLDKSREAAHESMVLLENDGVLPLDKNTKIALIGPYASNQSVIGPWSWHGSRELHESLETVLKENLVFVKSETDIKQYTKTDIEQIKAADCIIFALGEPDYFSGEAHSRTDITLPDNQEELIELAKQTSLPSVVLLFNGRPLVFNKVQKANALLECWFLGSASSLAIKDILFGDKNPSGKLPMTFPRNIGQIPVFYNYLRTGRPIIKTSKNTFVSRYIDSPNEPLYAFGYGLSYSKFEYSNLIVSKKQFNADEATDVSIHVFNNSNMGGLEVVQLYIRDYFAKISRPMKELKRFKKVYIKPFETITITFRLNIHDFMYELSTGETTYDPGKFCVMVGGSQENTLNCDIELLEA